MKGLTIDELLASLQNPAKAGELEGTVAEIWSRIGNKDSFSELSMDESELEEFLKEWIAENPYS